MPNAPITLSKVELLGMLMKAYQLGVDQTIRQETDIDKVAALIP